MRIAIIGSGAVGLFYGAVLQRGGHDVRFLLRTDYEAVSASGLTVHSIDGDFRLDRVLGFRDAADMGEVDLVLVALKAFANAHLAEMVRPLMEGDAAVLTLQNGLGNEELLADAFGASKVLGGVAMIGVGRTSPGVVNHMALGAIRLGEFAGGLSARAEAISAVFREAGIRCEAVADLRKIRWEKLVWNIPFNGLCTVTGETPSVLLARPDMRQLVTEIMREVVAGGNAQGFRDPIPEAFVAKMVSTTERHTGKHRPSMLIDRLAGRPLELDAIYRIPLEHAANRGVEMARVRMLHALLELGEKGVNRESPPG